MFAFMLISNWRLHKKMGYKGWSCLIPFYKEFCEIEALYGNGFYMFLPAGVTLFCLMLIGLDLSSSNLSNARESMEIASLIIFSLIVYYVVIYVRFIFKFVHAFGKDGWWTVGTLFFYPTMRIVYAVSDFKFRDIPYPDYDNYDAIDGFFEFFRNQNQKYKKMDFSVEQRCKKCGTVIRKGTTYCPNCGTNNEV